VGEGLQSAPSYLMKLFDTLTNIDFTWRSASGSNFVLVVDEEYAATVIRRLHHAIFEHDQRGKQGRADLRGWEEAST
jgi:aspartokinase